MVVSIAVKSVFAPGLVCVCWRCFVLGGLGLQKQTESNMRLSCAIIHFRKFTEVSA